jgi:hypothetical protein
MPRLSSILRGLPERAHTLGDVVDASDEAGFGFLAAFFALAALPVPPLSAPFGLGVAVLGLQILAGREDVWLPQRLRRRPLGHDTLVKLEARLGRFARRLERLSRPRLRSLVTGGRFARFIGAGLVIEGIALALPVPLPGGNLVFALPIFFYGLGLLEDDGVLVAAAHAMVAVSIGLAFAFFWQIVQGVDDAVRWIAGLVA